MLYLFITVNYDGLLAMGGVLLNDVKVKGDFDLDIIEIM